MAYFVNKAIVLGDIIDEPKLKELSNGGWLLTFCVTTKRSWNVSSGEKMSAVEYHNIVIFGDFAKICEEALNKHDKVYVEGVMETIEWVKNDGTKASKRQIRMMEILFLGKRSCESSKESENVF